MLTSNQIKFLTKNRKIDEQKQYRSLISTRSQYAASLDEHKKKLASVLSRIDEISNNNLNLEAERAKLNKTYNEIMLQKQLIKEAEEKRLLELERIKFEENKRLQEAEILRLELEKRKFDEERRLFEEVKQKELVPQVLPVAPAPAPVVDSPAPVIDSPAPIIDSPAAIVNTPVSPVAPAEAKKSNLGMILSVAAIGVGVYLYTKE
jgi:hypothetical protein